jgi:hypothetical protein
MRLKDGRFLALGEGGRLACRILSGDQFRLYVRLCDLADRETGRVELYYSDLVQYLRRCKRSLESDFRELRQKGVCVMTSAVNQHKKVQIEICDPFWDYIKAPSASEAAPNPGNAQPPKEGDEGCSACVSSAPGAAQIEPSANHETDTNAARSALVRYGISPDETERLVRDVSPGEIIDSIDYVANICSVKGSSIRSPQSLLVHRLRNRTGVPEDFLTGRRRQALTKAREHEERQQAELRRLELEYADWRKTQGETELNSRYSEGELNAKLADMARVAVASDPAFARVRRTELPKVLRLKLIKEICCELNLPSFEQWCEDHAAASARPNAEAQRD